MIFLGALLVALYAGYRSTEVRAGADKISAQLSLAQAQQVRVNAEFGARAPNLQLASELKKMSFDVKALQQIFDTLQTGEFGDTDGYSRYLQAFSRQITDGLWLTGFAIYGAGNEIALQGRTLRPELLPLYISRLTREPAMQGKSFSMLEMQQPENSADTGDAASGQAARRAGLANGASGAHASAAARYVEFRLQSAGIAHDALTSSRASAK
jgi:hypothetical protein